MGCTSSELNRCPECHAKIKNNPESKQHYCWYISKKITPVLHLPAPISQSTPSPFTTLNETIKVKVPIDDNKVKFKWINVQTVFYDQKIMMEKPQSMISRPFQQKLSWFRLNMEELRISWEKGSDVLKVSKDNILMTSKVGLQSLNLRKEIKIQFDDESVEDAGGLLREWMHLTVKEIFAPEMNIFELCDTEQTAYKIVWDDDLVKQYVNQHLQILGIIIGKAIYQRISLNCYLNKTILRQICKQAVHLCDVYSFDRQFYRQWKQILNMQNIEELGYDFCILHTDNNGNAKNIKLIKKGEKVMVNKENKHTYVQQLIKNYCTKSIKSYLQTLMKGIYKVIPPKFLSVFEPHELEMIMNGPIEIDVHDWKKFTQYDSYLPSDPIIQEFWKIVFSYDQEKLGHLLHYCTGSKCVPIRGFNYLESNRNTVTRFKIRKAVYCKDNPYPKSYTCFNRLELPPYQNLKELKERLDTIVKTQLCNFGLN